LIDHVVDSDLVAFQDCLVGFLVSLYRSFDELVDIFFRHFAPVDYGLERKKVCRKVSEKKVGVKKKFLANGDRIFIVDVEGLGDVQWLKMGRALHREVLE